MSPRPFDRTGTSARGAQKDRTTGVGAPAARHQSQLNCQRERERDHLPCYAATCAEALVRTWQPNLFMELAVMPRAPLRRRELHVVRDLERGRRRRRPLPTTVIWRWRYELLVVAGVGSGGRALADVVGLDTVMPLFLGTAAAAWSWPRSREVLVRAAWHMVTPHRLRRGCAAARIHTDAGRLPAVLCTRAIPGGHQVVLWCPAGCCAEDFEASRHLLRAACWAADVRVERHPRYSHVVYVDIVRDPAAPEPNVDRRDPPAGSRRAHGPIAGRRVPLGRGSSRDRVAALRRERPLPCWTRLRGVSSHGLLGGSRIRSGDGRVHNGRSATSPTVRLPRRRRDQVTGGGGR